LRSYLRPQTLPDADHRLYRLRSKEVRLLKVISTNINDCRHAEYQYDWWPRNQDAHCFFINLHFSVLYLYMEYISQRGYCGHQSGFMFISLIENMQPGDTDIHYWWPPIGEGLIISLAFFKQHYPTS
jgi:hypothetical protein